jgi:DNA-binding transcriptional ArsR family regulator
MQRAGRAQPCELSHMEGRECSPCQKQYIYYSGYMENDSAILALGALAQTTRLDVFRLLIRHEPEGLPAGEIARELDVPQNTMSTHLAILARAGMVRSERQSRSIIYRANLDQLQALTLFLVKDCCAGNTELCAPLIAELTPCC